MPRSEITWEKEHRDQEMWLPFSAPSSSHSGLLTFLSLNFLFYKNERADVRISEALSSASICDCVNFFNKHLPNTFCFHPSTNITSGPYHWYSGIMPWSCFVFPCFMFVGICYFFMVYLFLTFRFSSFLIKGHLCCFPNWLWGQGLCLACLCLFST